MSVLVNQSVPLVAAQGVKSNVVLQPGSVISARVVQVLGDDQARIAIGGQTIDVVSQVPLQAGQTLQLAVSQGSDSIRLAIVTPQDGASASPNSESLAGSAASLDQVTLAPGAAADFSQPIAASSVAPSHQLTPQQALAVSNAAQTAAAQQTSLGALFANLSVAAGLNSLSPQIRQAVTQLLAQRPSLDQNLTGAEVKNAFQSSGLLLEAHLAAGSAPSAAAPDLKAALIVLRQVLAASLNGATSNAAVGQNTTVLRGSTVIQGSIVEQGTPVQQAAAAQPQLVLQDAVPTVIVPAAGAPSSIAVLPQLVATTVGANAPVASPGLVPQPALDIAAANVQLSAAALPMMEQAAGSAASPAAVVPLPAAAAAALAAAANTAALSLLQETALATAPLAPGPSRLGFDAGLMLSLLPAVTGTRTQRIDDGEFPRSSVPPPPISGALPTAQPVIAATLMTNSPNETAMHHLIADTEGALARQTLLQVASLPDRVDTTAGRLDAPAPRWNFEIPFATPHGTAVAQFEISRDGGGNPVEPAKRVWRARFSLDVEPAGPVHALISLQGDRTSVRMWAERPATAAQLRAGAAQLNQALSRAELKPGDIVIRDGSPPQPAPAAAGHFLDRAL